MLLLLLSCIRYSCSCLKCCYTYSTRHDDNYSEYDMRQHCQRRNLSWGTRAHGVTQKFDSSIWMHIHAPITPTVAKTSTGYNCWVHERA